MPNSTMRANYSIKSGMRRVGCSILGNLFIAFGLAKQIKRKAKNGEFILSIYFHSPSKQLFEFCIQWLLKNQFIMLSQQDVLDIAGKRKPFPKNAVIITVDDGWKTNAENVVAIANHYKVPIAIFISTDPVEHGNFWWPYVSEAQKRKMIAVSVQDLKKLPNDQREKIVEDIKRAVVLEREALTINQLKEIVPSEFITIGGHTVTHPILTQCQDKKAYSELKTSKEILQGWISKKIDGFAYPNGDYGSREIKYLKETGYLLAYTTKPDYLKESTLEHIYELPRFCIFENSSKSEAICRILGIWQKFF